MSRDGNLSPSALFVVALLLLILRPGLGPLTLSAALPPTFAPGLSLGTVETFYINEASGIAASRQNPGVLWTHNDSHFGGTVFALSTNGALLAAYTIPSTFFDDFEDIAIGPGPSSEFQYIYLGDIGDNLVDRSSIRVFRFPEPAVYMYEAINPRFDSAASAQEILLTYPDGPADAEALMVDPITGDLFIATKLLNSSRIYRARRVELDAGGPVELTFVREISFFKVSGGDISVDGKLVVLRRGNKAALWVRRTGQSVGDVLGGTSINVPVVGEPNELNGEAIGFHPTGLGYYTISEGLNQPIYFFARVGLGIPIQPRMLIGPGESWRYQDAGNDEGVAWRQPAFDDSAWAAGPAQLGYGQGDEHTAISYGNNSSAKRTTTYFRKTFTIDGSGPLSNLILRLCFNDGAAVYLNGVEVFRRNLASDAPFDQLASASNAEQQNYWHSIRLDPALLHAGANTIAVELHRQSPNGTELSFDLQLIKGALDLSPGDTSDTIPPTVKILAPAANAVVTNDVLTVRGTASDNVAVARVEWSTGTAPFQLAIGTGNWSAEVPLEVGTNLVYAVAYDYRTNASVVAQRKVIRLATSPLTVQQSGYGVVTPNLDGATLIIGKSYILTATPAPRNLFAGWTGDIETNTTRLTFIMQSNLALQANFVTNPFIAVKGQYRGLFENPNQLSHENSGALTLNLTERGTFTATLRPGGKPVAMSGQFDLYGKAEKQIPFQRTNQLAVSFCLDLISGTEQISGLIVGSNWETQPLAYRSSSFSRTNPFTGRYTMYISGSTNSPGPLGHSVAATVVTGSGSMTLSGILADGTKVVQTGPLSRDGWWPFYLPLYRGKGSILGWLLFTNGFPNGIAGDLNWIKPSFPADKHYPDGFTNIVYAYGSSYSAQAMTNFLSTNISACLSVSGLLPDPQTNSLTLIAKNTFAGPDVKTLKVDLPTGLWTGSYTNPATGAVLPLKLTLLLPNGSGYGFILTTNRSAAVEWLPSP